jgi:NAD(P)-dependent dehydrogenase (short-subunit alcohol dehydrogenase family)
MQTYNPSMIARGYGRFLAIGSVQERKPHTHMAVYAASKCAIKSLVENVAVQVAADGVTVNMIAPGVILTPRNEDALLDSEYRARVLSRIPAGYEGEPRDIAAAALLLCSDEGRYVTGAELFIDGGMALGG